MSAPMKGAFMWVGAVIGALGGMFFWKYVGNLGLAMGLGAIAGMILSQTVYFRK